MSFRQNMLRGLGRCNIELSSAIDKEIYKDDVLYAALNPISYDSFFDGSKSLYIYNLISYYDNTQFFEDKIIDKLNNQKRLNEDIYNHLTDLLFQFANDGSNKAKEVLEEQYNILLNKKKLSELDYEKLCNLISIFDELYGNKRIDKVLDDLYYKTLKHSSFYIEELWYVRSLVYNIDKVFINKLKTYFSDMDYEYNKNNVPYMFTNSTIEDIKEANVCDLSVLALRLDKKYHEELIEYLIKLNDKERFINLVRLLKFSNKLFDKNVNLLLNNIKRLEIQNDFHVIHFLSRHRSKKLEKYAYELIEIPNLISYGIKILILNHQAKDCDLYKYFKAFKFNFKRNEANHVENLILYFKCGGNAENIKSLLIYYYENCFSSYSRKKILKLLIKNNMLNDNILNELQFDSDYDIRKIYKKLIKIN